MRGSMRREGVAPTGCGSRAGAPPRRNVPLVRAPSAAQYSVCAPPTQIWTPSPPPSSLFVPPLQPLHLWVLARHGEQQVALPLPALHLRAQGGGREGGRGGGEVRRLHRRRRAAQHPRPLVHPSPCAHTLTEAWSPTAIPLTASSNASNSRLPTTSPAPTSNDSGSSPPSRLSCSTCGVVVRVGGCVGVPVCPRGRRGVGQGRPGCERATLPPPCRSARPRTASAAAQCRPPQQPARRCRLCSASERERGCARACVSGQQGGRCTHENARTRPRRTHARTRAPCCSALAAAGRCCSPRRRARPCRRAAACSVASCAPPQRCCTHPAAAAAAARGGGGARRDTAARQASEEAMGRGGDGCRGGGAGAGALLPQSCGSKRGGCGAIGGERNARQGEASRADGWASPAHSGAHQRVRTPPGTPHATSGAERDSPHHRAAHYLRPRERSRSALRLHPLPAHQQHQDTGK